MLHVPLVFEDAQVCAHGAVTRRVWEVLQHLCGRGFPLPVENVHDLPLAAAELMRGWVSHGGRLWYREAVRVGRDRGYIGPAEAC